MPFRTFGTLAQETPMAPPFSLTAHGSATVRRFDYKQRTHLLIAFLDPADVDARTYARLLAEQYADIRFYDTEVLLLLATDAAGVETFVARTGALPFPVLADPNSVARAKYLALTAEPHATAALFAADRFAALQRYAAADSPAHLPDAPVITEMLAYLNATCDG